MTGMEHAIEQVARALYAHRQTVGDFPDGTTDWDDLPEPWRVEWREAGEFVVRALADDGLLAPAPLREEWGSEMRNARSESSSHVLYARDRDNAQWQIDHNPEWATGRIMHRYRTAWLPVDAIERATTPQEGS